MSANTGDQTEPNGDDLLDPRGVVEVAGEPIADRLETLEGTTVGLLDNSKNNADVLLEEVGRLLTTEYGVEATIYKRKNSSPIPADSLADQLHAQCDAVVNAYGDCGSCTSWCVYDSIDLERKGTPVATVNSDEFVKLGQSEARSLGMPGLPLVRVPHPMGDISNEEVQERTQNIIEEIVYVLTTSSNQLEDKYGSKFLAEDEELGDEAFYCPI